jgi:hypothetical protein
MSSSGLFRDRDERIDTVGNGLLGVETIQELARQHPAHEVEYNTENGYSRSLLSGEALEENLGVLVNLQVVHSVGVGRGGLKVAPALLTSDIANGRKGVTAEGLHDGKKVIEGGGGERGEERLRGKRLTRGRDVSKGFGMRAREFSFGTNLYLSGPDSSSDRCLGHQLFFYLIASTTPPLLTTTTSGIYLGRFDIFACFLFCVPWQLRRRCAVKLLQHGHHDHDRDGQ